MTWDRIASDMPTSARLRRQVKARLGPDAAAGKIEDRIRPGAMAAGMFLYGAPGNGKSTIAQRLTACFSQAVWIDDTLYLMQAPFLVAYRAVLTLIALRLVLWEGWGLLVGGTPASRACRRASSTPR